WLILIWIKIEISKEPNSLSVYDMKSILSLLDLFFASRKWFLRTFEECLRFRSILICLISLR
ncbi:hypothetical protein, partial [Bacillus cereus]|uniref:hypothetical protein n=1 Tax=Bacillus cereus TaxID=1396 RepID=UPI001CEFAAFF